MRWTFSVKISIALLFVVLAIDLPGQVVAFQGPSSNATLGFALDSAGDVNADGFDDIVVGAPFESATGVYAGSVRVISGFDHSAIHTIHGTTQSRLGWYVAGVGDVNADGYADFAASHYGGGYVRIYSGLDATPLFVFTSMGPSGDGFGTTFDGIGDVNGDGHTDLIIGAPIDSTYGYSRGRAMVYSGADGSLIYDLYGSAIRELFGASVAGAGDVNRDGIPDFIVGSSINGAFLNLPGTARVFSGADGSLIYDIDGPIPLARFGSAVAGAGDTNGDGYDDFIVGAPYTQAPPWYAGAAYVYSGFDGSLLHSVIGSDLHEYRGGNVSGAGDWDGDGFDDFVVGSPGSIANSGPVPRVTVHSGATGAVLFLSLPPLTGLAPYLGVMAGDLNGDGFADLAFGASSLLNGSFGNAGALYVKHAPTLPALHYRSQTLGNLGLNLSWQGSGGDPQALTGAFSLTGATAGGSGLLLSSLARIDYLAYGYLPLLAAPDPVNLMQYWFFGFDGQGELALSGVTRQYPNLAGTRILLQAFEWAPLIQASNGLRLELSN